MKAWTQYSPTAERLHTIGIVLGVVMTGLLAAAFLVLVLS